MSARSVKAAAAVRVIAPDRTGETEVVAADELARGLEAMLGRPVDRAGDPELGSTSIAVGLDGFASPPRLGMEALPGDSFEVIRAGKLILLRAGSSRGLLHAVVELLERLGARFAPGCGPLLPHIDPKALQPIGDFRVTPAFARRAFVSDIMTWNYNFPDRLERHLRHDKEFIRWMARRGVNAFSYIRHAHDTRLRIDEIADCYRRWGVGCEYGGHVLELLLPRDRFASNPGYFPAGRDHRRAPRGNLCVSNPVAVELVCENALRYVEEYPENELLHVWGADVWEGAWCRCGGCIEIPPQLQYMKVLNAIAAALARRPGGSPPVAYLAYHDTIEPHEGLHPLANVWFEWAPRERCYSHAIDDPACAANPRYFESLKRHIDLFDGRGHVFEYYADAILFGGLAFATPAVIARDLRAYRALGLRSISCLTFGAYSTMAYPLNLEAFVRATRSPDFDPTDVTADLAAARHPACAAEMAQAYTEIRRASAMVLDYADVMRPVMPPAKAVRKRRELREAAVLLGRAVEAATSVAEGLGGRLLRGEGDLWRYSSEVIGGLSEYLAAMEEDGSARSLKGESAVNKIAGAIEHIHAIEAEVRGTWGTYDIEWIREIWLRALRRRLDEREDPERRE